jgi:dephospho-CoA kinase
MTQNKKIVIGITGNSGSGKTTVANMLRKYGGHAIDADVVSHRAMEPGRDAYKFIVSAFGPDVLAADGKINRKALGHIAFGDIKKRTRLESIVHPIVTREILAEIAAADAPFVSLDAVLLVESGLHRHCDVLWLILAPADERMARITARDGLSPDAALARMRNQRDTSEIEKLANAVIYNDGGLDDLKSQVDNALEEIS